MAWEDAVDTSRDDRTLAESPRNPGREAGRWVQRNDTRVRKVVNLLEDNLGVPRHRGPRDALQVLILTVLSQNTTDPNALRAYERMLQAYPPRNHETDEDRTRFPRDDDGTIDAVRLRMSQAADAFPSPNWEAVRTADSGRLEETISVCGLQQSKAATIQRVLDWLHEQREDYRLEPLLEDCTPGEAVGRLASVKGIGDKTAAVTLMESRQVDLCPVDTHVHRICQRLRLVPPSSSRNKTFRALQPLIPDGKGHSLHHNLLTFGRSICTARNPSCDTCFLQKLCDYYRNQQNDEGLTLKFAKS